MNRVTAFLSLLALLKDTHALPTTDITAKVRLPGALFTTELDPKSPFLVR